MVVFQLLRKSKTSPLSLTRLILKGTTVICICTLLFCLNSLLGDFDTVSRNESVHPTLIEGRTFVAISSDDWGRWTDSVPLFPNASWAQQHHQLMIPQKYWYRQATVETANDILRLRDVLKKVRLALAQSYLISHNMHILYASRLYIE